MTVAARTAFLMQAYRFPGPREYVGAQLPADSNALPAARIPAGTGARSARPVRSRHPTPTGPNLTLSPSSSPGRRASPAPAPRLCIAQDHQPAALHSRGLDKCRICPVIMGPRYANSGDHGPQLCKHDQPQPVRAT